MRRSALVGLAGLVVLAGCGGPSADLFVIRRTGTVPGADFTTLVSDGGTVTCDGVRRPLPGALLLAARQLQRDLDRAATSGVRLAPGRQSVFSYGVTTPAGQFRFADDSPGVTPPMYRLAEFTRQVARQVCGRAR